MSVIIFCSCLYLRLYLSKINNRSDLMIITEHGGSVRDYLICQYLETAVNNNHKILANSDI